MWCVADMSAISGSQPYVHALLMPLVLLGSRDLTSPMPQNPGLSLSAFGPFTAWLCLGAPLPLVPTLLYPAVAADAKASLPQAASSGHAAVSISSLGSWPCLLCAELSLLSSWLSDLSFGPFISHLLILV